MAVQISVTELGPREYAVVLSEDDGGEPETTEHHVVVPSSLLERLLLDEEDGAALVRVSFDYLLERTTPDAVPDELVLSELEDEDEGYVEDVRARLP